MGTELPDLHKMFDAAFVVSDFTVTEDHLKLLRRANVSWNQTLSNISAPSIDTKRLTVTADHLKLLRRAHVSWSDGEADDWLLLSAARLRPVPPLTPAPRG